MAEYVVIILTQVVRTSARPEIKKHATTLDGARWVIKFTRLVTCYV